jgi:hypothetical protein
MARARDERGRYKSVTADEASAAVKAVGAETAVPVGGIGGDRPAKGDTKPGRGRATPSKKAKLTIFFRELSMLCNVSEALRRAGLKGQSSAVYDMRRTDAAFRSRWEDAFCESFAMLELEMLERSRFGEDRPAPKTDVEKRLRQVSTRQAMQLLKLYNDRVKARAAVAPPAPRRMNRQQARAIRVELDRMLSDFNRRMGGEG